MGEPEGFAPARLASGGVTCVEPCKGGGARRLHLRTVRPHFAERGLGLDQARPEIGMRLLPLTNPEATHGDALHPGEANFDETYRSDPEQLGVDEVGSFPADRSPFGVLDLAGNVAEWVNASEARAARGGYWDDGSFLARAASQSMRVGARAWGVGLRVCADAPERR
jgi:hypothetical protein